jgi:hypothetical protein
MYPADEVPPFVRAGTREEEAAQHPWLGWNTAATLPATHGDATLRQMRSAAAAPVSRTVACFC